MNILDKKVLHDQYFGLYKIDLRPHWDGQYAASPVLNPASFKEYADMRIMLKEIHHKFEWINSGMYLPDYVWLPDDYATFFKLKYGI
jgi:hypothetical protein